MTPGAAAPAAFGMSMTDRAARVLDRLSQPRRFAALLVLASASLGCWSLSYELPSPDAGAVLTQAMKIARGAVYYRDVDSYPLPAAPYLLAAAMRLFGEHLVVARVFAVLTWTGVVVAGYLAMLLLAGRRAAALGGLWLLAWKIFAHPAFHDALYPDVALGFGLWSIVGFLRFRDTGRRGAIVAAGVLAAMALLSKQNLGVYLGAAIGGLLLVTDRARRDGLPTHLSARLADVAAFGLGAALPLGVAAAYFQAHGVLGDALFSGFVRPFTGYLPTSGLSFLVPLEWWRFGRLQGADSFGYAIVPLFFLLTMDRIPFPSLAPLLWLAAELGVRLVYTSIPVVFAASAWVAVRERRGRPDAGDLPGLAVLALAVIGSAFPRADYYHVASVYPVVIVLAFVAGERLLAAAGAWAAVAHRAVATATGLMLAASLALTAGYFHGLTQVVGNERGTVLVPPAYAWTDDVIDYLDARLGEGDRLFVYGHEAYWYFFSGRVAAWPFVQMYPGMTGDDGGAALAESLRRDPPAVVVRGVLAGWPGLAPVTDYAAEVQAFLDECYEATTQPFSDGLGPDAPAPPGWLCTVMERRSPAGERCGR